MSLHNPECFARHMGMYAIEPRWLQTTYSAIKAGKWADTPSQAARVDASEQRKPYPVSEGVAILSLDGPLMKFDSKFGGTNTVRVRSAIRAAANDADVGAIVLRVDSPGGHVAGTKELADDVKTAAAQKPVYAFIEDFGASAAYWIASQAKKVFANETAMIGSIGTIAVLEDTSKAAEMAGVKVHVISTGGFKGAFADGTEVQPEHLEYFQDLVNKLNEFFLAGVAEGRGIEMKAVRALADGRLHMASDAKKLGLIDGVKSFDATMTEAYDAAKKKLDKRKMRAESAEIAIRIAEAGTHTD